MSGTCDLCHLDIGDEDFHLNAEGETRHFCCDACRGIYVMIHDIDFREEDGAADSQSDRDGA